MPIEFALPYGYQFPYGKKVVNLSKVMLGWQEKLYIVLAADKKYGGTASLASKYSLNHRTISKWRNLFISGKVPQSSVGRPDIVDLSHLESIVEPVLQVQKNQNCVDENNFGNIVKDAAKKSCASRGVLLTSLVCRNTCVKYRKKLGINVENGSIITSARSKEEIEVKNAVSSIVMLNAIFTIVRKAHIFINFDATSFQLSSEYTKKTKKVVTMKSEKGSQASKVRPNTGSHNLNYFIKYCCIITAGCVLCPFLVF